MSLPFTLRQIEVFVETARTGHLTQAASRMNLTQSAASTALSKLEQALGGQLFNRSGRRLSLNERGRLLFPRAEAVIQEAHALLDSAGGTGQRLSGHLVVACSSTIGNYLMPQRLAAFRGTYAGVEVTLKIGNTREVAQMVREMHADVGLVEGEVEDDQLDQHDWMEDELVVICEPRHPFVGLEPVDMERLAAEQWLTRERGSGTLRTLQRVLEARHLRLAHAQELGHTEAIKRAVEAGLGISCLSRLAVERELAAGTLSAIALRVPIRRWFRLLIIPGMPQRGPKRAFCDWLLRANPGG